MTTNALQMQAAQQTHALPAAGSPWRGLYRVGAGAAIALVACTFFQAAVYILRPPPSFLPSAGAVVDWFTMLHENWLVGLLNLDLVMLFDYPANLLLLLALCVALWKTNRALVAMGAALGLAGIVSYFAVNPAFSMLVLSEQYVSAASEAERTTAVAAGQALLAVFAGSGFVTSYIMIAVAGLLVSITMLQSGTFGRGTAYVGIVFYAMNLVPASAGTLGLVLSLASLVPMLLWLVLVARRLLRLARQEDR